MFVSSPRMSRVLVLSIGFSLLAVSANAGGFIEVPSLTDSRTRDVLRVDLESAHIAFGQERADEDGSVQLTLRSSAAAAQLLRAATKGGEIDEITVWLASPASTCASDKRTKCYLKYKLDRCFIKSWSLSSPPDPDSAVQPEEAVAFYYNKIAFAD